MMAGRGVRISIIDTPTKNIEEIIANSLEKTPELESIKYHIAIIRSEIERARAERKRYEVKS